MRAKTTFSWFEPLWKLHVQRTLKRETIFQLKEISDYFTHTWSLGVEMQFYLVAPLMLLVGKVRNSCTIFFAEDSESF